MNYVVNMLAKPSAILTSQMQNTDNVDSGMDIYLKNSFVCLSSVKLHNSSVRCILCVSFQLNEEWRVRFLNQNIEVHEVEFGKHRIGDKYNWGIVQYRYDVMQYLCDNLQPSDNVIMLDTDVICVGMLNEAFEEIENRPLLYDVQHCLLHRDRRSIRDNFLKLYPQVSHCELTHFGGEFIGANITALRKILEESEKIICLTDEVSELENLNDEHITSIAVYNMQMGYSDKRMCCIGNANAYIYRFWTRNSFYLASTCHSSNRVVLWHLPDEKTTGILYVYRQMQKNKEIMDTGKMMKLFGLPICRRTNAIFGLYVRILRKMRML